MLWLCYDSNVGLPVTSYLQEACKLLQPGSSHRQTVISSTLIDTGCAVHCTMEPMNWMRNGDTGNIMTLGASNQQQAIATSQKSQIERSLEVRRSWRSSVNSCVFATRHSRSEKLS
ncbi:unnamed protein product [Cercospora beticola]|nr:unnamed protein product [Cercospora beticola]